MGAFWAEGSGGEERELEAGRTLRMIMSRWLPLEVWLGFQI